MTINSIPIRGWIYLGIIGNLKADNNSYSDFTSYGWAGNSQVYKGGSNKSEASGWMGFVEGEYLYFHLKENKLTMFSVQKKRAFVIDIMTTFDAYIHFDTPFSGTEWTLESLNQADYEVTTTTRS